ncbi:cupin domain-containing protein [Alteromonas sp. ALT199]|uniref:cupin domain-containing protein n=1 Tax=unclassified Alteromonas TaxID=2614992 RepID=UPI000452F4E3|nr:cupin domain-containing protein [Alteromonas sp. ALT199]MBT3135786.1 cupin domain-containing protein [Alteromonas sp. ALT199]
MTNHLVRKYNLEPHPEGGFYRQVFRSKNETTSYVHNKSRPALTHIYFLLLRGQVSRFHRVLHDEVWNHYEGAPLQLFQLENQQVSERRIGGPNHEYVEIVNAGNFQAATTMGDYSLVGCSVAPGFDFQDFSFIEEPSMQEWIKVAHPDLAKFI